MFVGTINTCTFEYEAYTTQRYDVRIKLLSDDISLAQYYSSFRLISSDSFEDANLCVGGSLSEEIVDHVPWSKNAPALEKLRVLLQRGTQALENLRARG